MSRIIWFFIGLGVACAAAAGFFALKRDPPPQPDLIVSDAEQDLGEVSIGIHEVSINVFNPSTQPRRVLGLTEGCFAGGYCINMRHPDETNVPAKGSCLFKFNLLIKKPGPFHAHGTLFLEGNGLQEVPLKIHGSAVAPPRKSEVSKL